MKWQADSNQNIHFLFGDLINHPELQALKALEKVLGYASSFPWLYFLWFLICKPKMKNVITFYQIQTLGPVTRVHWVLCWSVFHRCNQNAWKEHLEEDIYFGPWFQRIPSMVSWLQGRNIMAEGWTEESCSAHSSRELSKRSWRQDKPFHGIPPMTYFLQLASTSQ